MVALEQLVATAIQKMALVDSEAEKSELHRVARECTMEKWRSMSANKVAAVGGLTGLLGGPVGLALEAGDMAYLFASAGRACYGVGHIRGVTIDYDQDIPLILAIWCGVAEAASTIGLGKVGIKVAGKVSAQAVGKVAGKVVAKVALKGSAKASQKIVAKASGKLIAKLTAKVGLKWVPIIGGLASAAINLWVVHGLIDAADAYYSHEYVTLDPDLAADLAT